MLHGCVPWMCNKNIVSVEYLDWLLINPAVILVVVVVLLAVFQAKI